jgi:diadenosine tetraphosphate (Ap4A) HIT family hydrolase
MLECKPDNFTVKEQSHMAYYYSPFRKAYGDTRHKGEETCPFCSAENRSLQGIKNSQGVLMENDSYFWMVNYFPKFEGHTMIVPKRHVRSLNEEYPEEIVARHRLSLFAMKQLEKLYPGCGFEIFIQYGPGSAQSVEHLHWHVLPARPDDTLRSFEKLGHFYATEEGKEKTLIFPMKIDLAREDLVLKLMEAIGDETCLS